MPFPDQEKIGEVEFLIGRSALGTLAWHRSPLAIAEDPGVSADRFVLDADCVVPVFVADQVKELSRIKWLRLFEDLLGEAGPAGQKSCQLHATLAFQQNGGVDLAIAVEVTG